VTAKALAQQRTAPCERDGCLSLFTRRRFSHKPFKCKVILTCKLFTKYRLSSLRRVIAFRLIDLTSRLPCVLHLPLATNALTGQEILYVLRLDLISFSVLVAYLLPLRARNTIQCMNNFNCSTDIEVITWDWRFTRQEVICACLALSITSLYRLCLGARDKGIVSRVRGLIQSCTAHTCQYSARFAMASASGASLPVSFHMGFERLKDLMSKNDACAMTSIIMKDVWTAAKDIERQLELWRSLRDFRRIQSFLAGIEQYSKVVEVVCNETSYLSYIWASFTLNVSHDFSWDSN